MINLLKEIAACTHGDPQRKSPKHRGKWLTVMMRPALWDRIVKAAAGQPVETPKLSVAYHAMPESNGRNNWTALLYSADKSECFTIDRSEYPHRVRYEADRMRHIIGELAEAPFILDYDADEQTPCHLCGGSGEKDGKPCYGLNFRGTVHNMETPK